MIVSLTVAASAADRPQAKLKRAETGAGSLTAARKYLEGRWSLVSFDLYPKAEERVAIPGEGSLTYDQYGNLAMELRVDEKTADLLEGLGVPSTKGRISMSGRTVVDMQARTLVYFFNGQPSYGRPTGPLALSRPRHWNVEENVLTLSTKADDGRPLSVARWERVVQEKAP